MDGTVGPAMAATCPRADQRCSDLIGSVGAAVADLDRLKQDLISTVNHELRTPLSSILGYCELLDDHADLDPTARSMVDVIQRNSMRLVTLITDLLLLARLDGDGQAEAWEPVNLVDLVASVAARVEEAANAAGLAVRVRLPDAPMEVMGEQGLLERAVHHLATNAVKFAGGGRNLTFRVVLEEPSGTSTGGPSAVVEVADDGPGVDLAELPTMTERFVRARIAQRDQVPGAGLGLSVVSSVADHHGGRLDLASRPGEGVTARIRLPLATVVRRSSRSSGVSMSPW